MPAIVPKTPAVNGHVYNAHTHQPIAGATVTFEGFRGIATATDEKGSFCLPSHTKLGWLPVLPFDARSFKTQILIQHADYLDYTSWVRLDRPTPEMKVPLKPSH